MRYLWGLRKQDVERAEGTLDASEELIDLVSFAMDYGIDNVRGGGTLVPFLVTVGEDGRALHRLALPNLEEGLEVGRQMIRRLDSRTVRYALTYDGYYTRLGGERHDAIFVEAAERGKDTYTFAQQYRPRGFLRAVRVLGSLAFVGRIRGAGESFGQTGV
jgi:hypothetical protein